jgi:uncharacterized sporulation protein YeaH/YhbH (DUF444 family)
MIRNEPLKNLRCNANTGSPGIHQSASYDLRYKTWEDIYKPHSNAAVIKIMDIPGS